MIFLPDYLVKSENIGNVFIVVLTHIVVKGVRRDERYRKLPLIKQQHVAKPQFLPSKTLPFQVGRYRFLFLSHPFLPQKRVSSPLSLPLKHLFLRNPSS